jgi:hypothetical protein
MDNSLVHGELNALAIPLKGEGSFKVGIETYFEIFEPH